VAARLSLLTDARYVDVNVDTDHFAVALLGRERPDMVPLELTSHGTRDQVTLLLRLALCEVLGGAGEPAPLCLDEPLLTADARRRDVFLDFLHKLSETHQVVLATANPEVAATMRAVSADDCAVISLDSGVAGAQSSVETTGRRVGRVRVL